MHKSKQNMSDAIPPSDIGVSLNIFAPLSQCSLYVRSLLHAECFLLKRGKGHFFMQDAQFISIRLNCSSYFYVEVPL